MQTKNKNEVQLTPQKAIDYLRQFSKVNLAFIHDLLAKIISTLDVTVPTPDRLYDFNIDIPQTIPRETSINIINKLGNDLDFWPSRVEITNFRSFHIVSNADQRLNIKLFFSELDKMMVNNTEDVKALHAQDISPVIKQETILPKNFNPKIIVKKFRKQDTGFLQLYPRTKPLVIGTTKSRQYKLVCCLFNKDNDADKPYVLIYRRSDTVFDFIRKSEDDKNINLKNASTQHDEIIRIIEYAIGELQKKPVGKCLNFKRDQNDFYAMGIMPFQGNSKSQSDSVKKTYKKSLIK